MNNAALDRLFVIRDGVEPLPQLYGTLGISVLSAEPGSVAMQLVPAPAHSNPHGVVGGGVIATILDTSAAWACDTDCSAGSSCVTIDLNVNFHRPVKTDAGSLTALATLVHSGARIKVAHGKLVNSDGKLVATAVATCMVVESK